MCKSFFTTLMRELLSPSLTVLLFEGKDFCFIPIHNTDALSSNLFKVAGKMVAASICHGGPGLPVFPKAVYSYFKDPNPDSIIDEISKEYVVDMEVEAINKVKSLYGYSRAGNFLKSIHNNAVENSHRAQFHEFAHHFLRNKIESLIS